MANTTTPRRAGMRPALDLDQLRDDLRQVRTRISRSPARPAVDRDQDSLDRIVTRWASVACQYRDASASPADRKRWTDLVDSTCRDRGASLTPYEALFARTGAVRDLLTAIQTRTRPGLSVDQIVTEIQRRIDQRHYPVGASLPRNRIVSDLNARPDDVKLALADLTAAGVVERHGCGVAPVEGGGSRRWVDEYIADRLREAIITGLYPPGASLPSLAGLSAVFVTDQHRVTAGLRLLVADGLVVLPAGERARVHRDVVLVSSSALPQPVRAERQMTFDSAAIRVAIGEAKGQWRYRRHVFPELVEAQWTDLRAMARHLLTAPTACDEAARRWAALMADAPLPTDPVTRLWHTACLGAALAPLLPPPPVAEARTSPSLRKWL
ncbi:GntR family transcriptional regulator [Streptomyces albipurpureus]|uniref:GntR family transcriptional regulator n=1 Tax=Streptomyces albipurpureus TaxID=2897419 RepID=A0ABT0UVX3_9ACTN|nr:GntR family transcriptional regulator [Streptomyces sp. CWNU-1]MCM2392728.1 GntR family transcriptional regulator [Streptomyces sp. CWNU-1]